MKAQEYRAIRERLKMDDCGMETDLHSGQSCARPDMRQTKKLTPIMLDAETTAKLEELAERETGGNRSRMVRALIRERWAAMAEKTPP